MIATPVRGRKLFPRRYLARLISRRAADTLEPRPLPPLTSRRLLDPVVNTLKTREPF